MIARRILSQGIDVARVLLAVPSVERGRRTVGPLPLTERLRAVGRKRPRRSPSERRSLSRAIAWVDALCPGGSNCYRRALLELALDPDAAEEPLVIGLCTRGARPRGHAWISGLEEPIEPYDVRIEIPSTGACEPAHRSRSSPE